jgi:hypothetical protein
LGQLGLGRTLGGMWGVGGLEIGSGRK